MNPSRFRNRVYRYAINHPDKEELIFKEFNKLTQHFIEIAGIKTDEQRMDSSLLSSNIKRAGRISLAFDVLEQAIKALPEEILTESLKKY